MILMFLAFSMIAAACVSVDDSAPTVAQGSSGPVNLAGAILATDTVEELDRLCITGIDVGADLAQLELFMLADGVEPVSLPLYRDGEALYVIAPLHPLTPGSGGPVEVQFVNGDDRGPTLPLDLTALPEAPGAWDATIAAMTQELDDRAVELGSSLDELASTPFEEVGGALALLWMVKGYVDDGTKNDLESLLSRPDASFTVEARAFIDSVVAKIDPLSLVVAGSDEVEACSLGDSPGGVESLSATPDGIGPVAEVARQDAIASTAGTRLDRDPALPILATRAFQRGDANALTAVGGVRRPALAAQADACRAFDLTISNAEQLASAVEKGVDAQVREGGAEEKVLEDINAVINVGSDIPVYGEWIGAVGTMFAALSFWYNMDAGTYPTQFTTITAQTTTDEFNEDYKEPGRVEKVTVVATSTGFDASAAVSSVLDAIVNKGVGKLVNSYKGLDAQGNQIDPDFIEQSFLDVGARLRSAATARLVEEFGERFVRYCPQQWSVDIANPTYVDISAVTQHLKVNKSALTYEPAKLGSDSLRVRARADAFFGLTVQTDIPMETKKLRVITTPSSDIVVASPSDVVNITTVLENADTTTLFWNTPAGTWDDGTGADTNDGRTRPLRTPSDPDQFPFTVEVRSTSETGLRAESTEIRNDQVTVRLQGLFVLPDPGRVLVEQQLPFFATDRNGNPREVTWRATGGLIDRVGIYSAGDRPGIYTVTATAVNDRRITATVNVEVVEAKCPVGMWRLREQDFLDQIEDTIAGPGISVSYESGQYRMIFYPDGTLTGIRDNFGVRSEEIGEGAIIVTINATDPGIWSTQGDQLTIIAEGSEPEVSMVIIRDGVATVLPSGTISVNTDAISGTGPFSCVNDVFQFTSEGITATFDFLGPPQGSNGG